MLVLIGSHRPWWLHPVDAVCSLIYIYISSSFPVARKIKKHEKLKKRKLQDSKMTLDGIVLPADN